MKKTRKTPRPWTDEHLRYLYSISHMDDEIAWAFPGDIRDAKVPVGGKTIVNISRCLSDGVDVHHISGGILGTPRWDIETNLIKLSRPTHVFCDTYVKDGFVLCAASKIKSRSWDKKQMAAIMGVDSTRGWVEGRMPFEFDWVEPIYREFRRKL